MSGGGKGSDFTFSSSSEVKTFVRAKLGMPDSDSKGMVNPRISNFRDLNNQLVAKQTNGAANMTYQMSKSLIFRQLFNPIDYDG